MASLDDMALALADLSSVPSRAATGAAKRINALIGDQFDAETDPFGEPWKPLEESTVRRKGGDRRILRRTDALAGATHAKPVRPAGIEITSLDYGMFHQTGTVHMVAREILPEGELPPEWEEAIEDEIEIAFGRTA